jgi:HAD superfamily hydrolase (TIGR01509 family)
MDPAAIVFDLDGVLVDSEQLWDEVRREVVAGRGGRWTDEATTAMQGMSTPEWAAYLTTLGAAGTPDELATAVIGAMADRYREHVPLLPGAVEAVTALSERWPLAVASSSPPELIRVVLAAAGVADRFRVTVSSEEVERGKPAPDVYLAAADRLGAGPARCVAIEDSGNGLRAAAAAGMTVVAVPNPHFPPPADALALAAATVPTPAGLTPELVTGL